VPITRIAKEVTGRRITASIVALGIVSGLTGMVSPAALEMAVRERVPAGTEDINLKALAAGLAQAEKIRQERGEQPCA
jgi:2-oxoglutarate ferredoxin oxidoreductase subunit gamma